MSRSKSSVPSLFARSVSATNRLRGLSRLLPLPCAHRTTPLAPGGTDRSPPESPSRFGLSPSPQSPFVGADFVAHGNGGLQLDQDDCTPAATTILPFEALPYRSPAAQRGEDSAAIRRAAEILRAPIAFSALGTIVLEYVPRITARFFVGRRAARSQRGGNDMRIGDIMSEEVDTISFGASVGEARELMKRNDIRHLVVMDGTRVAGVVSARDLGRSGSGNDETWIENVMSSPIATADRKTTLRQAANLLRGRRIGCLPVIKKGKPVGMITISDLLDVLGKGVSRTPPGASHWEEKHRGRRRSRHVPTR